MAVAFKYWEPTMASNQISKSSQNIPAEPRDFFDAMRREFSRVFDRIDAGQSNWPALVSKGGVELIAPDFDIYETAQGFNIEAEVPGVDEKDIDVTFANGLLTVKGEKKFEREEKKENYYLSERSFGSFQRSFRLPETVDEGKIEAHIEKGVLKIAAPKRASAKAAERRIEIKKP